MFIFYIPSNINTKRNNQRNYSFRGRTNPDNRMRSSKDELDLMVNQVLTMVNKNLEKKYNFTMEIKMQICRMNMKEEGI